MSPPPTLLPTAAQSETFAGITYHLDGEPVPVHHFLSVDREVLLLGHTAK